MKTGSCAFLVHSFAKGLCIWKDIRQNNLNVISLKRGEFKLSIGGSNNNIPYMAQKLLRILQSAWSWQTRDFNMALNVEAREMEQMTITC